MLTKLAAWGTGSDNCPPLMNRPAREAFWSTPSRIILRIGGSVVILAALLIFLPRQELWSTMRRVPLMLWLLVLASYLGGHLVGATKWRLIVNLAGAGLSFTQGLRCYFAGLFSTLFLPSIVGGDLVRAGFALRMGRNKAGALLGSFLDRTIDFVVLASLATLGALLAPEALDPRSRWIFVSVALALAAMALAAALLAALLPAQRFSYRIRRWLARTRQAARPMAQRPRSVLAAFGLGLVIQTSLIALTVVLAGACGLHLRFRMWLFAWPLAKLSAVLPVSQGGIGVREAALAALLAPFGARPAMVVAVGLVWETIIIAGGLAGGLVAFLAGRSLEKSVSGEPVP